MEYSKEQLDEIQTRIEKANTMLKDLQLQVAASVSPVMINGVGENNVFAFKLTPQFADLKYAEQPKTKEEQVKQITEAEIVQPK